MTIKLRDFLKATPYTQKNIAGFLDGDVFHYWESSNPRLPAYINCSQSCPMTVRKIYTNYTNSKTSWVRFGSPSVKGLTSLQSETGDGAKLVTLEKHDPRIWPLSMRANGGSAPFPEGGLHAAAVEVASRDPDTYVRGGAKDGSHKTGVTRSLRYYMLAAYGLLDKSSGDAFAGLGNYVATLLVGDTGTILAAGINTGSYRHAEVSMLISYFRQNPTAQQLPAKSVVFSTLTPCEQCTAYLKEARAPDTQIYFGQFDSGKFGKAGAEISKRLADQMDGPKAILDKAIDEAAGGVASDAGAGAVYKTVIANGLTSCMGSGSIASQISDSEEARRILKGANAALMEKATRVRSDIAEEQAKGAALTYLTTWLSRASQSYL